MSGWNDVLHQAGFSFENELLTGVAAILILFFALMIPVSALFSYVDRKISADLQARVGPNRAGPAGLFQPLSDLIKLLQKGNLKSGRWLWLVLQTAVLFSSAVCLPIASQMALVDVEMSAFLPLFILLAYAITVMVLGLSQHTISGWLGGVRVASQVLAASFPAFIAILSLGLYAKTFSWTEIVASQGFSPLSWHLFRDPFLFFQFPIFVVSGLAIVGLSPVDGGQSAFDIQGGVSSEFSGFQVVLLRLTKQYAFYFWCLIATVLFLGGWAVPNKSEGFFDSLGLVGQHRAVEFIVLHLKVFALAIGVIVVSRVTPRLRSDQVTDFVWKVLSPMSLMGFAGSLLVLAWRAAS